MKMRMLGVSCASFLLTAVVIANAYFQKKQFYPTVVYITKSNPSMAVIYIQAFIGVYLIGKLTRKIFFGQLRTTEFEHLMERSWYAITETCLAFTVFRDDFNPKFVALFTLLLFLKSFHWLAEDRVDYMERSPVISWLFHIRIVSLLLLLGSLDLNFITHAYSSTVTKGASVQLVFGFEYAVLITVVANIAIKYALHSVDINRETPWDNKAVFLLYTELVMGLIKVVLYVAFVAIMVKIYTLPLFAFRPMYYTIRNFKKAFTDVILSRRAIHNMNTLYPDATPEELAAADNVCIICREEMVTASKKLPCNHIFHTSCLRSWFQRQQTCPTCRLNILRTPPPTNNNEARAQAGPRAPAPPNLNANPFFNMFAGPNPFQAFNQPGNMGNAVPNMPNVGVVPPQPQNVPAAQQAQTGGVQNATQPQATPNQSQPTTSVPPPMGIPISPPPFPLPPFMMPPMPFMPFMVPPPMPPVNLSSMTEEELRRLEGQERQNIEARIKCLRNIQTLLDAAVVMMQQYSHSVTHNQPMFNASTLGNTFQANSQPTNSGDAAGSSGSSSNSAASASPKRTSEKSSDIPGPSSAGETSSIGASNTVSDKTAPTLTKINGAKENVESATLASTSFSRPVSPEEEVRKRRLQKFLQQEQQPQD